MALAVLPMVELVKVAEVVEVLGSGYNDLKIFLQLDFVYGWWHTKFH